jgi:hypothetical protein
MSQLCLLVVLALFAALCSAQIPSMYQVANSTGNIEILAANSTGCCPTNLYTPRVTYTVNATQFDVLIIVGAGFNDPYNCSLDNNTMFSYRNVVSNANGTYSGDFYADGISRGYSACFALVQHSDGLFVKANVGAGACPNVTDLTVSCSYNDLTVGMITVGKELS